MKKAKHLLTSFAVLIMIISLMGCGLKDKFVLKDKVETSTEAKSDKKDKADKSDKKGSSGSMSTDEVINVLKTATSGTTFTFGSYDQDGKAKNGKEPIEWIVLYNRPGKALVTSKYILTARPYHDTNEDVTWKNTSSRKWLNSEFYDDAFSSDEKALILSNKTEMQYVKFDDYSQYTEESDDSLFFLSVWEYRRYLEPLGDDIWKGVATETAKNDKDNHLYVSDEGYSSFLTRSMGESSYRKVTAVGSYGLDTYRDVTDSTGIRPAMWISWDADYAAKYERGEAEGLTDEKLDAKLKDLKVGDEFAFGAVVTYYYGLVDLTWKVVSIDEAEGTALVFSTSGMDSQPYHESGDATGITWSNCSLRDYMNSDGFFDLAFSTTERDRIVLSDVPAAPHEEFWERPIGEATRDYLYLPSREDIEELYPEESERFFAGSMWLRNPAFVEPNFAYMSQDGYVGSKDCYDHCGVFPMMRIKIK